MNTNALKDINLKDYALCPKQMKIAFALNVGR